ncbi:uncharacterized protein FOMMEDRAFT_29447 [Fomitiporia mediterranea MF3/22]|uniref:uncharacterized protein n=1 Tax=Fomitiporia mediterranea (strain MF3/22) TaxID=694068 RepID=UPI00044073D8|nr:uncharacterized protein FOMMEDRAFT_29447 [Fomitiporia mediterranea MF3/22]EJD02430.1 hypothetical protein FOMMEDRAFT_29447 [Fomitiporia mediterranea MF3/22]
MTEPKKPFPHVVDLSNYVLPPPRTLHELAMVKLSASIREKPNWWLKYTDPEIRARWRKEAQEMALVWIERATMLVPFEDASKYITGDHGQGSILNSTVTLTEKEVDYILDELDGYAKLREEQSGIQASIDKLHNSTILIGSDLLARLKKGVAVLEDVPDSENDWHPGSNEQVLDLVHPSLYCVVYGRTLAYPRTNNTLTKTAASPAPLKPPTFVTLARELSSQRFQWLPTDFSIDAEGKAKALSYINNLHPSHMELYDAVEGIISAFVPLFERVLTDMLNPLPHRIPGEYLPLKEVDPRHPQNEDAEDYYEELEGYIDNIWEEDRIVGLPQVPEEGYTGGREKRDNNVSLRGRTIQVIVKLANIHLTPEKPEYKGGSWHIEGMGNERIVSSGIYYYEQENITGSELAFRIAVDEPEPATKIQADTYDYHAHYKTWGMIMDYDDSTNLTNVVGATPTVEGRCLAFPNIYQHRVSPFRLTDPTKLGHRKILALFLVDPNLEEPIPSTSIVPPQQQSWIKQALHEAEPSTLLHKLPAELLDAIAKQASPEVMSEEDAKKFRLELMEERSAQEKDDNRYDYDLYSRVFNLCEH